MVKGWRGCTEAWQRKHMAVDYKKLAGKFIVFDGPDGCGKTTQMQLFEKKLTEAGLTVKRLREPGGTSIGEQIREVLLAVKNEGMDVRCEMLLYMASRAQLVQQEIKPALARGEVVLSDRYASSTIAYQGGGGGLPVEAIMQVAEIAVDRVWPHLTVVFDISIDDAQRRLHAPTTSKKKGNGQTPKVMPGLFADRIEQRETSYHEKVRAAYLAQVERWPERHCKVDAAQAIEAVEGQVTEAITRFFQL